MDKIKLAVSFSGGETSAYMAQWIHRHWSKNHDILFLFANTGQENEATYDFIQKCSDHFGFKVIWLELVPMIIVDGQRVPINRDNYNSNWVGKCGNDYKIVDYYTANRSGVPFEKLIMKYGMPNMAQPLCSTQLKERVMSNYLRSIGWKNYYTAIGIRTDEADRVSVHKHKLRLLYPLVFPHAMSKPQINKYWSEMPFRLELKGYQGNCKWCWKKSDSKLAQIAKDNVNAFMFPALMDELYSTHIPAPRKEKFLAEGTVLHLPIRMFRNNRSTQQIIDMAREHAGTNSNEAANTEYQIRMFDDFDIDGDSCEVFTKCE